MISSKLRNSRNCSWYDAPTLQLNVLIGFLDTTGIHDVPEEKIENGPLPPDSLLSKSAVPDLINMAGDRVPANPLDLLSDNFASLRKDGLIHKPGNHTLRGGMKNCSVPMDDRKASEASSLRTVPSTLHITPAMAQGINADIKNQLMKEVRKFGRSKSQEHSSIIQWEFLFSLLIHKRLELILY